MTCQLVPMSGLQKWLGGAGGSYLFALWQISRTFARKLRRYRIIALEAFYNVIESFTRHETCRALCASQTVHAFRRSSSTFAQHRKPKNNQLIVCIVAILFRQAQSMVSQLVFFFTCNLSRAVSRNDHAQRKSYRKFLQRHFSKFLSISETTPRGMVT